MKVVPVRLGERRYQVAVGEGVRHELAAALTEVVPDARRAAIVTQPGIGVTVDTGLPAEVFEVPDGEGAKSLGQVELLCPRVRPDRARSIGRGDCGGRRGGHRPGRFCGGVVPPRHALCERGHHTARAGGRGHRGQDRGQHSGGEEPGGRVLAAEGGLLRHRSAGDPAPREWASGRGEMAKYAFLGVGAAPGVEPGGSLLELPLPEQVARCVEIKAEVVEADEREGDRRMTLNYGHTLAHALEAIAFDPDAGLDLRHGEAVAIGLVFAALLARRLGRIDDRQVERHRQVVSAFDLSPVLPDLVDPERLFTFIGRDKKARHDLTFVLDGPDGVEVVHGIEEADVVATLAEMQRTGSGRSR